MKRNRHKIVAAIFILLIAIPFFPISSAVNKKESPRVSGNKFPLLKVDFAHLMIERSDGSRAIPYRISPSLGVILDASSYNFRTVPSIPDLPINLIMVSQGKEKQYAVSWKRGKTLYELSTETLKPINDSKEFVGFIAGDEIIITIGTFKEIGSLTMAWMGIVQVK